MGVIQRIASTILEVTANIDEEVKKGYDLSRWGDLMKYLHALQIQAQALLDLVQSICAILRLNVSTYIESGKALVREGILTEEDFKLYRRIVGFRNILIHQYSKVDIGIVDKVLRNREYRIVVSLMEKILNNPKVKNKDP